MNHKKHVIAIGILTLIGITCFFRYDNTNSKILRLYKKTTTNSKYIMHALGGINGIYSYTNSKEALMETYNQGYRLFETDVHFTSDHILVLTHGWRKKDFEQKMGLDYSQYNGAMDYHSFNTAKLNGLFTTMSFKDLVLFMDRNRDMFVMIDSGNISYEETHDIYNAIVSTAKENCKKPDHVLQRMIVGGHTPDMIEAVKDTYNFSLINLYLAKEEKRADGLKTLDEFFEYCEENNISSFSTDKSVFTEEVALYAQRSGMIGYIFTINSLSDIDFEPSNNNKIVIGTDFLR